MKKTIPLIILIAIVVLIVSLVTLKHFRVSKSTENRETSEIQLDNSQKVLYVSDSCPHCRNVEDFVEKNNVFEKVSFIQKEISKNIANAKELESRGASCQIPTAELGVPLFWNGEKCFLGDQEIIQYFQSQLNEK